MKNILKTLKIKEWIFVLITIALIIVQVWLDLELPEYMAEITSLVTAAGGTMGQIIEAGLIMLGIALGSLALTVIVGYFAAVIATTVAKRLRYGVYEKTMSFTKGDINNFSTGSLITRTTNDITQVQQFIAMGYTAIVRAPLIAIMAILKIAGKNGSFITITVAAVVALLIVLLSMILLAIPKSKKLQKLTDKLNTTTREHLTGVRVVRAYNAEDFQEEKFEQANEEYKKTNLFIGRATAIMRPFMNVLMTGLTLAIYWVGAFAIDSANLMDKGIIFADMVVFSSYSIQIIMAFLMLTFMFIMLPRVVVSVKRISEVINFKNTVKNDAVIPGTSVSVNKIEFQNVCFKYPGSDEMVLENLNFVIEKGSTTSFIGSTGSGKSTIINLLLRFYDVTSGEILINDINIKNIDAVRLRDMFGYVSQKATLFSGSVESNITMGVKEANEKELKQAIKIAQAQDFVNKIGLSGRVSQGGINLSGGQKQRLSIARAIYKNPDAFIFDDCFSALDYKTDRVLRQELNKSTTNKTKLIVGQRISTVKDSDQIIVLDQGKIMGMGEHKKLLKTCNVYKEIAESQLSKEELANAK